MNRIETHNLIEILIKFIAVVDVIMKKISHSLSSFWGHLRWNSGSIYVVQYTHVCGTREGVLGIYCLFCSLVLVASHNLTTWNTSNNISTWYFCNNRFIHWKHTYIYFNFEILVKILWNPIVIGISIHIQCICVLYTWNDGRNVTEMCNGMASNASQTNASQIVIHI